MQPDVPAMGRREAALGPLGPGVLRCVPEQVAPTGESCLPDTFTGLGRNVLHGPKLSEPGTQAPRESRAHASKQAVGAHRLAASPPEEAWPVRSPRRWHGSFSLLCTAPWPTRACRQQHPPADGNPPPCRGKAEWESTLKLTPRGVTSSGPITPQRKDPLHKGKWITCGLQAALKTSHVADFHEVSPHLFQSSGHGRHAAHSAAHTPPASREDLDVHRTAAAFTTGLPERSLKLTSVVSQRFLNTL